MSAREVPPLPGNLSLEVWLGPMEGIRCAKPLGPGPLLLRMGRRHSDERRGVRNDLILGDSERISGFHAEIRFSEERLFLKDLNSLNGTYADGKRVSGEVPLQSGDVFLLATTPVQVLISEHTAPKTETGLFSEKSSDAAALEKMLAAARSSARRRGDAYIDTRHLADALLRSADSGVVSSLEAAGLSEEKALGDLWGPPLMGRGREWLVRFMEAPGEASKKVEPVLSTRVNSLFQTAGRRLAAARGADPASQSVGILFALLLQSPGPVAEWLTGRGVEGPQMTEDRRIGPPDRRRGGRNRISRTVRLDASEIAAVRRSSRIETETGTAGDRAGTASQGASAPTSPAAIAITPSTGDVLLDQRARAIAQEIEEGALLYRFSTPEDRRSALKAIVTKALAAVSPENRARILSQIRIQFPVVSVPQVEAPEAIEPLQRRIRELEQTVAELSAVDRTQRNERPSEKSPPPSGPVNWSGVFSAAPLADTAPQEAVLLKEVVEFACRMEKFLLGLIQGVTMPGNVTTSFRLPSYRYTLESTFDTLKQGKPIERERVDDYLRELERWQVAILAGYHAGAGEWFTHLWTKISPTAIEASASRPAAWKLQGGAGEFWSRYREAVKGLNAEVVQDQVLQASYRVAQKEYEKLTKRRA